MTSKNSNLQFYQVQLTLLRHNLVNVRLEVGVRLEHFGPDAPLHRGLDLGLCARRKAERDTRLLADNGRVTVVRARYRNFCLLFLKHIDVSPGGAAHQVV